MLFSSEARIPDGRILTRWRLGDLINGASDLGAYPLARRLGFSFHVRQDFHGKVFAIPDNGIIVGSANATLSGLGIKVNSNSELCTLVPFCDVNRMLLEQLFEGSVEMTDMLFDDISATVADFAMQKNKSYEWPESLMDKLHPPDFSGRILMSECFFSVPLIDKYGVILGLEDHDLRLLGLSRSNLNKSALDTAFKKTRPYRWLIHTLKSSNGEAYFGSLSEAFHSVLLDDPKVYRRNVKTILQILLSWCDLLGIDEVVVDRPNYSQRVRLA